MVVQISSPSGDSGSPEDTHIEEDQASPTDAEMDAAAAAAAGPSDNTKDTPTAPKSPEEVSVVSPTASPVPDTPAREPSPPKDTPESSQDTELVGETISEDSVQALTDIEAPSGDSEAKQDTAQDSTPRDTSNPSKDIPPRSSPTLPDAATAAPGESEEGNTSPHEIATVYIIEPKQENVSPEKQVPEIVEVTPEVSDEDSQQQQQQHPEPQLEPAAPEKESSNKQHKQEVIEVSPGRADKEAVVGSQLELRTKKVKVPRKETHFFEPTVVPPEKQKLMVMCYVCDTNVKVAKFKHHLFFGFVRCHYCNRRLMGCRLLMEDLNNPEKSVCFSSPSRVHSFSKWAGDPIEHLSYYIRKDLVIKRFCAGKTKPPPVPEIVAEIHSYISRLSVLESIGPWCYAFERCQKYIQERINAEPKAFDQNLRNSISASLAAHSARLGPSSPLVDRAKSPNTEGSRPATSTPPQERTATPPVPQPAEDKESRTLPVIQAVTSEKVTVEPVIVMEPPVTQSEESVDDPMETVDDPLSDAPENAPPTPEASTPASTPQPAEVPHKTPRSAEKPSEETTSRVTPPPKAMPVNQTITRLRDMLSGSVNSSRRSSPSRSSRTSKTATPEPPPTAQSDVELVNDTRTTTNSATTTAAITTTTITTRTAAITKKSIAGTTLIRQWGTKAKVHTPAVRRSTQGESWPVKNENYLIIKYPTEACPDLCPSCYTAFNPMQATVQCSSFLMTVRCESCKLTLFVSQDPPSPRPRKKRRL
ncbi:bromodomain-containing protein 4-like [Portunus trituberculatus]|nr:bromodomain-containing protein 4-like [Portunus trituberculatus]